MDETINADSLVSSVSKTLGSDYSCELWACAPAPLPLKPLVGGYPIFIPKGHVKTFGEMDPKIKFQIDHRCIAYSKIKKLICNQ